MGEFPPSGLRGLVMSVRGSVVGMSVLGLALVTLPASPGHGESTVEVPIQVSNCSSCEVFAQGIDEFGDFWDQAVRLRNGVGAFQVPVSVACFPFGSGTKDTGHIIIAFDICLLGKIQITSICLGFSSKSFL